jgi:hypothetical protein
LEDLFERSAKTQPAITAPCTLLAPALKTPYRLRWAEVQRGRVLSGFGMYPFVALETDRRCPIFELFGQKRGSAYKTGTAVPQFFQEFNPRGVGE